MRASIQRCTKKTEGKIDKTDNTKQNKTETGTKVLFTLALPQLYNEIRVKPLDNIPLLELEWLATALTRLLYVKCAL